MGKDNKTKTEKKSFRKQLGYILFLIKPYWKYGKLYMIVTLFLSAVLQPISSVLSTLLPKEAIDAVMRGDTTRSIIITVSLFTLAIAVIWVVQNVVSTMYSQYTQQKIYYKLLYEINVQALQSDFKYYDNPEFFTKFTYAQQYYPQQAMQVSSIVPQIVQSVVTAAAMGALIAAAGPVLLIITLVVVILQSMTQIPQAKLNASYTIELTEKARPINYVYRIMQMKENTSEMRTSGAGGKLLKSFETALDKYAAIYAKLLKQMAKYSIPQRILSPIQTSVILLYIIIFIIDGDLTKIGLYASLTAASAALSNNISSLFNNITQLFTGMLYGENIAAFFEAESIIEPQVDNAAPPPDGIYDVELRDISFRYENAAFGLEHFNLKIPAGQRVAIVGENGAGKSTLTKLLLRLYDVDSGAVLINGRDIREFDVHKLRRRIGIAYQDVRILAMSLRDNLTVYNDVGDDELRDVMSRLGLDSVLEKVGDNLDTMVSREFTEDGAVLSGGEAQRLSLARLFTGPFGLLLLDEPSSALDPLAEHKLMQLILDKSNTATTVMIAHRLSTVRSFDVIYHIEDGKIIETGTHDELMAMHGKYYEMFTRQAENYQNETVNETVTV